MLTESQAKELLQPQVGVVTGPTLIGSRALTANISSGNDLGFPRDKDYLGQQLQSLHEAGRSILELMYQM